MNVDYVCWFRVVLSPFETADVEETFFWVVVSSLRDERNEDVVTPGSVNGSAGMTCWEHSGSNKKNHLLYPGTWNQQQSSIMKN